MLIKYQEKQLVPFEFKWVNDSNYIDCSELVAQAFGDGLSKNIIYAGDSYLAKKVNQELVKEEVKFTH